MNNARITRGLAVVLALAAALSAGASAAGASANGTLSSDQAKLASVEAQLEHAKAQLDLAQRTLQGDRAEESLLRRQLGSIARYEYQSPSLLERLLDSGSLADALSAISETQIVGERWQRLLEQERALTSQDAQARASAAAAVRTLESDRAQAQQVVLDDQALEAQAAAVALAASAGTGAPGNHFAYGYCTWYVANRRPIPWFGNAIDWWPNARAYGFLEGQAPQVGAVMVTRESSLGHVAYVEAVNSDGSWTVSEMNYVAWDVVDRRTIRPGQVPLVGFIYGHG